MGRRLAKCLIACFGLAVGVLLHGSQKWNLPLDKLGDAEEMVLVTEGDSGYVRCKYKQGPWARFNWPRERANADNHSVTFKVRRAAGVKLPYAVSVRVLQEDGSEWRVIHALKIEQEWKTYTLTRKDFVYYRGGDEGAHSQCDFGKVQQFQILPEGPRRGGGTFEIDDVQVLPHGTKYTHDKAEWRSELDFVTVEYERLKDLHGRLDAELRRISLNEKQLRDWISILKDAKGRWASDRQGVEALLSRPTNPWLTASSDNGFLYSASVLAPFQTFEAFAAQVKSFEPGVTLLNDYSTGSRLHNHVMYEAKQQDMPVVMNEDGIRFVRQRVVFTGANTQAVFVNFDLPKNVRTSGGYLDVTDRVIEMKIRCTATKPFHKIRPFILRICSEIPSKEESFIDIIGVPLPTSDWQTIRFDLTKSLRSARADTKRVHRLTLRMENREGVGGETFNLDVQPMYMREIDGLTRTVNHWLEWRRDVLLKARTKLLGLRMELTALEESLRDVPALRDCYLSSFYRGLAVADVVKPLAKHPLGETERSMKTVMPYVFLTRNEIAAGGRQRIHVSFDRKVDADVLEAVLELPNGGAAIAHGRSEAKGTESLTAFVETTVPAWAPFVPNVYTLVMVARKGGRVVALDRREIGFRRADIMQSGLSTLIRHAWNRNRPDWSYFYNGVPSFVRTAASNCLSQNMETCPTAAIRLHQDLWVEGHRTYGAVRSKQYWTNFERMGFGQIGFVSPSYRFLKSYNDMKMLLDGYDMDTPFLNRYMSYGSPFFIQVGNEVELVCWGADICAAFRETGFQPLDGIAEVVRRKRLDTAPVMYVRAGHYNRVEPLPHEDVSGINQYTGRYSGLLDQIHRSLAELGAQATLFNRPIAIMEWNGPKYSWGSTGIGGVTLRGAAYYLEKYWRAIVQTPGIVGSSEFTLNWVFAPFEDFTNQTREEAYKDRPRHQQFGGGTTADHVPLVDADKVVPDDCYRSMQGFHSPLYIMVHTPGEIAIQCEDAKAGDVQRLATALRKLGKSVKVIGMGVKPERGVHCIVLAPVKATSGWFREYIQPLPASMAEPSIQTALRRDGHEHLVTVMLSLDAGAHKRGVVRLVESAEALVELAEKETAMPRMFVLTDANTHYVMMDYFANHVARGYFYFGGDVDVTMNADRFLDASGEFRTGWKDFGALVLDISRALTDDELRVVRKAHASGANLILSRKFVVANPSFANVRFEPNGTFAQELTLVNDLAPERNPLPLKWLGGAELDRVRRFRPTFAKHSGLNVYRIFGKGGASGKALAVDSRGDAVILDLGKSTGTSGRTIVLGYNVGEVALVQRRTTTAGVTHPLYDRDMACGLERPCMAVVNCALLDHKGVSLSEKRPAKWLKLQYLPQSMFVRRGETPRLRVLVRDSQGQIPENIELEVQSRLVIDGKAKRLSPYFRVKPVSPGVYDIEMKGVSGPIKRNYASMFSQLPYYLHNEKHGVSKILSLQFKSYGTDAIPEDGAFSFIME